MKSSKSILISFLAAIFFHGDVLSQQCAMHEVPYISTGFNDSVRMKAIYDSVSSDMSGNSTLMLINSYGQVRKRKAYVVTVDSVGTIVCGFEMTEDFTGVTCKKASMNRNYKSLLSDTLQKAQLLGSSSTGTAHMNSILLISNRKKGIRLEYQDLDGDGRSCIKKAAAPALMKYAVELLEDVFKDSL